VTLPARGPAATTRLFVLLGDPVAHSLSPLIQNAAIRAAGVDAVYLALPCSRDDVGGLLRGVARAGGGGNITVPHKVRAARLVDVASPAVRLTGACNTFWLDKGRIHGDNTDVTGFDGAARALVGELTGLRVLLLGAGGAARAAACALLGAGAAGITVLNRSTARARGLRRALGHPPRLGLSSSVRRLRREHFDLAVNATPLGLHAQDALPLPLDAVRDLGAVLDLAYAADCTAWVRVARDAGIPAMDGKEMLLQQAAAAFQDWWRRPAPLQAMRTALVEAVQP
jgi:shikimate dehydrogenase